jgi:glycerol-3-phosphate dehydrogenase
MNVVVVGGGSWGTAFSRLLRVTARERHVVATIPEEAGEGRPPGAAADDDGAHYLRTKSMETGTPSRSKRSRSWFSTQ